MLGISTAICYTPAPDELLSITAKQCKLNPRFVTTYKAESQKRPSSNGAPGLWLQVCQNSRKQEAPSQPASAWHNFHSSPSTISVL